MPWRPQVEREASSVRSLSPEQVEHLACCAAEDGNTAIEQVCDDVLAGYTDSVLLVDLIDLDDEVRSWMARGAGRGWHVRPAL